MRKLIAQEDNFGCAVACVANLLNIDYKDAKILFDKPENANSIGYFCEDIIFVLGNTYTKIRRI